MNGLSCPSREAALVLERSGAELVLIVAQAPSSLGVMVDALDESGYSVQLESDSGAALALAAQLQPDILLIEAALEGMDGFELARQLKADPRTAAIPIVFMTGRSDVDQLVTALEAGGVDCVAKPVKMRELLARMALHLRGARERRQARNALDAFGYATIAVRASDGRLMWETPLARELLLRYCGTLAPQTPQAVLTWLRRVAAQAAQLAEQHVEPPRLSLALGSQRLTLRLHQQTGDDDWLIIMREESDASVIEAIGQAFRLTAREAEVLYWVVKGKINRDIGDILGTSPMTVKKHLEHVFAKLGVETRTAAAGMVMGRIAQLGAA